MTTNMDEETLRALVDYNRAVIALAEVVRETAESMRKAKASSDEAMESMNRLLEDVHNYSLGGGIGNKINLARKDASLANRPGF